MQVRPSSRISRLRRDHGPRPPRPKPATGPAAERQPFEAPRVAQERVRPRRHGGETQDQALYRCSCGMVFEARVTTAVSCPHCAAPQAW